VPNRTAVRPRQRQRAIPRPICLIACLFAIASIGRLANRAIADDSPQGLWTNSSPPSAAANGAAGAKPAANSPQALWGGSFPSSTIANTAADAKTPQALWADSYQPKAAANAAASDASPPPLWTDATATDDLPPASDAQKLTPSQTFWASVDRGYQALKPKGYPGWGPGALFQPTESTWYTRVDYYHWSERYQRANIEDEIGALPTLGYTRTGGEQRFRAEIFGGTVQYQGAALLNNGTVVASSERIYYYGGRVEYDLFFNCPNHPNCLWFIGIGTRVWNRNLPNFTINPGNLLIEGLNQTWVTLYPYIGVETRHDPSRPVEFYGRMRVGLTAFTYMYENFPAGNGVYPLPGATALLEEGVRYHDFTLTGYAEVFGWAQSHISGGYFSETSTLLTIGAKAGYSF